MPQTEVVEFVRDSNIRRYRRLLELSTEESQRQLLLKLLSEEQERMLAEVQPKAK